MNGCLIERLNVTGKWYSLKVKHDINKVIDTFIRSDIESMPPESQTSFCMKFTMVYFEVKHSYLNDISQYINLCIGGGGGQKGFVCQ